MAKKIFLLFLALLVISCGSSRSSSSKSKSTSSRNVKRTPVKRQVIARTTPKPGQTSSKKEIKENYKKAIEEDKSDSKTTVYSKSEILEATTRVKVTTQMVHDYINQFKDIAKSNMRDYGIPASIILGQGILESGAGTGPLSQLANNHFGIKCHKEWTGPSVAYDDDAAGECFRKYDRSAQSYEDHSLFLTSRSRYATLFDLDRDDYKKWAKGLRAAGYATDPKYPEKLIGIIERYQLYQYDSEVLGREFTPSSTKELISENSDLYQVSKGDTLYSISKKFNLSVDELRRKNNLTENVISIGQQLRIR